MNFALQMGGVSLHRPAFTSDKLRIMDSHCCLCAQGLNQLKVAVSEAPRTRIVNQKCAQDFALTRTKLHAKKTAYSNMSPGNPHIPRIIQHIIDNNGGPFPEYRVQHSHPFHCTQMTKM